MKLISKVTALCIIWTISAILSVNAASEPDGKKNSNPAHLLLPTNSN